MTRIVWSPQALQDIESIREYIAQDSHRYAELVVGRIIASVERLRAFPGSGRVVPERGDPEVRGYDLEFFSARGETVAVMSVPSTAVRPAKSHEVLTVRRFRAS